MDEAERCHRINYISLGRLVASGTVAEVIASAGLTTFLLREGDITAAQRLLAGMPGIDEITHFGKTLHVVGRDAQALRQSVGTVAGQTGTRAEPIETSLEDAFIQVHGRHRCQGSNGANGTAGVNRT